MKKLFMYSFLFIAISIASNLQAFGERQCNQPIQNSANVDNIDVDDAPNYIEDLLDTRFWINASYRDRAEHLQRLLPLVELDLDQRQTALLNYALAKRHYDLGNYPEARRLFELVINNPESTQQMIDNSNFQLGKIYFSGYGVNVNYHMAKQFYQRVVNSNWAISFEARYKIDEINRMLEAIPEEDVNAVA